MQRAAPAAYYRRKAWNNPEKEMSVNPGAINILSEMPTWGVIVVTALVAALIAAWYLREEKKCNR